MARRQQRAAVREAGVRAGGVQHDERPRAGNLLPVRCKVARRVAAAFARRAADRRPLSTMGFFFV
eukprot:10139060-Lingulodinium_polyedra.AAC.1